ncbi:citrate synthase [Comamonadaceae bacterium G21597-S1]|nr:citrate synthase [Comamonadaceae bacterium G21597-S1]
MLDAKSAASLLGVKTQTLYAYVSRGLIRTAMRPGTQASLYHREDIEALRQNRRGGAPSADSADRALRWGASTQVVHTAITVIDPAGPRYRGKLAVELANTRRPFEDCVELLWTGALPRHSLVWQPPPLPSSFELLVPSFAGLTQRCTTRQLLALVAQTYGAFCGRNPENAIGASALAGRHIVQVMAAAMGLLGARPQFDLGREPESVAALLARSMRLPESPEVVRLLDAALILSADHELAPSTYAARIAASAGGDLFACVVSALGTFEGPLTGFACDEAEKLLRQADSVNAYVQSLRELAERKEGVPGYNHPLYDGIDPRAAHLLTLAQGVASMPPRAHLVLDCIEAARAKMQMAPSLAVGLVALAASLDMPVDAPGGIMAVGRAAGWIAHALEQRLAGYLVRPRTKYIGLLE